MEKKINKKTKVSIGHESLSISNDLLGAGLSSGHKLEFMIQQTVYLKTERTKATISYRNTVKTV